MAVSKEPVLKRCRSLDLNPSYLGTDKKSSREPQRANKKMSEYGLQLREKQRAKFIYGVLEKQFKNTYIKASKKKGKAGENLLQALEQRLDNVVFRAGLAATRAEARQLVSHGHFTINGKKVNIPSYSVSVGEVIAVADKSKESPKFKAIAEALVGKTSVAWLDVNKENLSAKVIALPTREDIDFEINEQLIVELYSR